ncbi:hypothetical protein CBM2589_B20020 [Cupriavidus taiwanensis]|uniref:Uncharacterized protein n=1 Tax=Cupriavidus taiwanensis TaxID=164546 RepID=A0A375BM16_9BURK|nr:hypothetical protein CBM2589_B20020 [Cupriavidus taiwanensis]
MRPHQYPPQGLARARRPGHQGQGHVRASGASGRRAAAPSGNPRGAAGGDRRSWRRCDDAALRGNARGCRPAARGGGVAARRDAATRRGGVCRGGVVAAGWAADRGRAQVRLKSMAAAPTLWIRRPSPPAPLPQAGEGSKPSASEGVRACQRPVHSLPSPARGRGVGERAGASTKGPIRNFVYEAYHER